MTTLNKKQNELREELKKIMPGYKWTVHKGRSRFPMGWTFINVTGIQSAGFRRLSTLQVQRAEKAEAVRYMVKGYGGGVKAPRLYSTEAHTLARALRQLQDHYEKQAHIYMSAAECLHNGRKAVKP